MSQTPLSRRRFLQSVAAAAAVGPFLSTPSRAGFNSGRCRLSTVSMLFFFKSVIQKTSSMFSTTWRNLSSLSRSDSSARLRSVISTNIFTAPTSVPESSRRSVG